MNNPVEVANPQAVIINFPVFGAVVLVIAGAALYGMGRSDSAKEYARQREDLINLNRSMQNTLVDLAAKVVDGQKKSFSESRAST